MANGVLSRWLARINPAWPVLTFVSAARRAEIRDEVARTGRWQRHEEWRISTVTSLLIERTGEPGYRKYLVRVECDYVLEARCPTLSRAIEIAHLYEQLIPCFWQRYGWPSWASRSELEPGADDE